MQHFTPQKERQMDSCRETWLASLQVGSKLCVHNLVFSLQVTCITTKNVHYDIERTLLESLVVRIAAIYWLPTTPRTKKLRALIHHPTGEQRSWRQLCHCKSCSFFSLLIFRLIFWTCSIPAVKQGWLLNSYIRSSKNSLNTSENYATVSL